MVEKCFVQRKMTLEIIKSYFDALSKIILSHRRQAEALGLVRGDEDAALGHEGRPRREVPRAKPQGPPARLRRPLPHPLALRLPRGRALHQVHL